MKRWGIALVAVGILAVGGCFAPRIPPVAQFVDCPDGWRGGLDVQFTSTSTTAEGHWIVRTDWDFGDGTVWSDAGGWVSHAFEGPGDYTVRLTVTDDRGVSSEAARVVRVVPVVELFDVSWSTGFPTRVLGTMRNASPHDLRSVVVRVKFYDRDDVRIAETLVDVNGIEPGERVRFAAEVPAGVGDVVSVRASVASFVADCGVGPIPWPVVEEPAADRP
ncbi:MAG: PKD domain-containing protein [Candidatus Bipolaricaulota bacterium]